MKTQRLSILTLIGIVALFSVNCGSSVKFGSLPAVTNCSPNGSGACGVIVKPPSSRETAIMSAGLVTKNSACVMCHTRVTGNMEGFGTMIFRADSLGEVLGNIYAADIKLQHFINNGSANVLDSSVIDTDSDPQIISKTLPELQSQNLVSKGGTLTVIPGEEHNKFFNISFLSGGDFYSLTSNDSTKRSVANDHLIRDSFGVRPIIHDADFPLLDPVSCISSTSGNITLANGQVLTSPINGNVILVNGTQLVNPSVASPANSFNNYDPTCPSGQTLKITGEVVIQGDLVLAGCIKGQGTIYVTGNILIPDDIKLINSPFPYPPSVSDSVLQPDVLSKPNQDMLSLGAAKFILVGVPNFKVITNEEQDPIFRNNMSQLTNVFNWLSTGTPAQNQALYNSSFLKRPFSGHYTKLDGTANATATPGAVSLLEANLYANLGIAATSVGGENTNLVINGSVMTPNFSSLTIGWNYRHYDVNGAFTPNNPFNGQPYDTNEINQDYRLKYTRKGYECHRAYTL